MTACCRGGLEPGGSIYPGDDEPDTGHFGALTEERLIAVASICREAPRTDGGHSAALIWCTARLKAVAFYQRLGFRVIGEPYVEMQLDPARRAAIPPAARSTSR